MIQPETNDLYCTEESSGDGAISAAEDGNLTRMLQTFPLSETELLRLLAIRSRFDKDGYTLVAFFDQPDDSSTFVQSSVLPDCFLGEFLKVAASSVFMIGSTPEDQLENWIFLEAAVTCLGRRGPRPLLDIIFSFCQTYHRTEVVQTETILNLIYRIVVASHILRIGVPHTEVVVKTPLSWMKSLPTEISRLEFVKWVSDVMPFMYTAASTMFHCIFFSADHATFRPAPFCLPRLDAGTLLWTNPWESIPVSLACHSSCLGGDWRRQYSSNDDSFSFRAFANALIGYKGPTIILIKAISGDTLGFYSDAVWKFSNTWFGSDAHSFIFCADPIRFFHPTGTGKTYQYLCLPPSHRERDLKGLAIGGINANCPRLHLTESLECCRASSVDTTFENGPLLLDDMESYFDVDILEVFAVNVSDDAYMDFQKRGDLQVAIHEATRRHAATVDRTQFLDDFVAGAFLNKGFEHREHTCGRHEFRRDED